MPLTIRLLPTLLLSLLLPCMTAAQEFRAMWADTFHAGLRNSTETTALVAAARSAKCNAIVVEVRKRGDAYYRNGLEPVATDVASGFDPLADLIQRAHTGSPRIDVHAWIVSYNIWGDEDTAPPQPTHPFNLHPDWVSQNNVGSQWDGANYQFDPGHPAVQKHTFDVAMDILSRYDIDGLHLDYIRYSENGGASTNYQPWGYNPVALARFKRLNNRTATPTPGDSLWLQWRRDQVTALVRKIYLNAWVLKPNVRISAAVIPWGSPPADLSLGTWQSKDAYARVLQDWRGWLEEGIVDLACPMIYRTDNSGFGGWSDFAKDRKYNRAVAIGMGWYANTVSNTIAQIKLTRNLSANANSAAGVLGYSYAVPNSQSVSQTQMWKALTDDATAETYDPGGTPVFASTATLPPMPWKSDNTKGHLMGYVREGSTTGVALDGATLTLTGPANRTLKSDGTGFFGAVDLPTGTYTLAITAPGFRTRLQTIVVTGATVAQPLPIALEQVPLQITSAVRNATTGRMTITWASVPGRTYRVEGSNQPQQWTMVAAGIQATSTSTSYQWQVPSAWQSQAFVRVVQE